MPNVVFPDGPEPYVTIGNSGVTIPLLGGGTVRMGVNGIEVFDSTGDLVSVFD